MSSSAREPSLTASGSDDWSNPVAVTAGCIFWHGVHKSRDEAIRLRDEFAKPLPAGDWFAPHSKRYADELTKALRMTERVDA